MNETSSTPQPTPEQELLAERERAIALLSFLPETRSYTLYCAHTGVAIASMNLLMQAGKLPYLSQWKESISYHPIFSLAPLPLLAWTRKNWNRIFREGASEHASDLEKQQFQIAFVAVLHTLGSIKQETPVLPSFDTVQRNMQSLLELAYWYVYLDSKRFQFPTLRINRLNANSALADIHIYFDVCRSVRDDYSRKRDSLADDARADIAARVERAVRGSHVKAVSRKALWNWFLSCLACSDNKKKYEYPEWKEWKDTSKKLFLASENGQLQFSTDDVDAIEDVFLNECELGTTISHTFQSELSKIRKHIHEHNTMWDIDLFASSERRATSGGTISLPEPEQPGPAPLPRDYNSRFDFLKAEAAWKLRKAKWEDWKAQQPTNNPDE